MSKKTTDAQEKIAAVNLYFNHFGSNSPPLAA